MTEPQRDDWLAIVTELEANGVGPYVTAKRMGVQFVQAQRVHELCKAGKEPRDYAARWLRALHGENVPGSRFAEAVSRET